MNFIQFLQKLSLSSFPSIDLKGSLKVHPFPEYFFIVLKGKSVGNIYLNQLLFYQNNYALTYIYIYCVMDSDNKESNKEKDEQKPTKEEEDINKLISEFEQEGELNLTNEQKKQGEDEAEDAEVMKKIKEEYEKFMKEMQAGEQGEGDMGVGDLGKAFEDLLKGLGGDDDKAGEAIGQKFESMFKNMESPDNFQKAASQLLNEFMDKSLLQQPLKETKLNYEQYMKKVQEKGNSVQKSHRDQYDIVCELVQVLEKEPSNKQKMIDLFSKLQQKGTPPEGIAPSFGFF